MTIRTIVAGASALLLGVAVATSAAAGPSSRTKAQSRPKAPKPFAVQSRGMMLLTPTVAPPADTEQVVRQGDVLASAPVAWVRTARLPTELTGTVADLPFTLPADTLLMGVKARGGNIASLPPSAEVFCASPQVDMGKVLGSSLTFGLSNIGNRYARETQVCLVDTEGDGTADGVFLVGAKRPEDRVIAALPPAPITAESGRPVGEHYVMSIIYDDGGVLRPPNLSLQAVVPGADGNVESVVFGDGPVVRQVPVMTKLHDGRFPQELTVGSAAFTVTALDIKAGTATIRHKAPLQPGPFAAKLRPQTIYIFVPG